MQGHLVALTEPLQGLSPVNYESEPSPLLLVMSRLGFLDMYNICALILPKVDLVT